MQQNKSFFSQTVPHIKQNTLSIQLIVITCRSFAERVCSSLTSYDALVLCHPADSNFILTEFLPKIEQGAGLKLCIPGRDLAAGGLSYKTQLEAMCKRLVSVGNSFVL